MRIATLGSLAAALVLLGGCFTYSGTQDVKTLSADLARTARIGTITIHDVPANVTATFKPALEKALRERTSACAKGTVELALDVSISLVKVKSVGRAFLIGDSSIIKGMARLSKPDSGDIVGDYDISHSVGGGGLLPAVAMAGEEGLADDFAVEFCDRAFRPKGRRR